MKTNDLIAGLVADQEWRVRPVWLWLLAGMVAALPFSVWLFMMTLGVRPDVTTAVHNPFFDMKFVITIALASTMAVLALHMSRPNASLENRIWLFAIPAGVLGAAVTVELAVHPRSTWLPRMVGSNSVYCLASIPMMSAPLLIGALATLRHGATTRPVLSGAVAGLMSAGIAATIYAIHCTDDSPLFVAVWYTIASALVAIAGGVIGKRVLRF